MVIQAGRKRIAVGWYKCLKNEWQAQGGVRGATIDELADEIESPTYVAGELSSEDRSRLARKRVNILLASPVHCIRRPSILADLAWARWQKNEWMMPPRLRLFICMLRERRFYERHPSQNDIG